MKRTEAKMWWASLVALAATVAALPWCLGGALPVSYWVMLVGASLSFLFWAIDAVQSERRVRLHVLVVPLLLGAFFSLLQIVPLPPAVLGVMSPRVTELRDFALIPLGLDRWRPISHDVPATLMSLGRMGALLVLTFVACQLGKEKRARSVLSVTVAAVGLSIAVCGLAHKLFGMEELFGFYRFYAGLPLVTPFGNSNHLAAFEALTSVVAISLAVDSQSRPQIFAWSAASLLCLITVFLSLSRGGSAIAVAVLLLVFGVVALKNRSRILIPAAVALLGIAIATVFAWEELRSRAETLSTLERLQSSKIGTWPMMTHAITANWPLGMGHGAFEVAFPRDQILMLDLTFTHPENIVLQFMADFGIPAAVLLLLLLAFAFQRVWVHSRDSLVERVLLLGVLGTALHDVFDFSLELNAVLPAAMVLWAVVAGRRAADRELKTRAPAIGVTAALCVVSAVSLIAGRPTFHDSEKRIAEHSAAGASADELRAQSIAAIDRHPADWVLYAAVAEQSALAHKPQDTLAWVNRVIFLRPFDARAHVLAGEALRQLGARTQALIEYKIAFSQGNQTALRQAMALCAPTKDCERVLVAVPGFVTEAWKELLRQKHPEAGIAFLKVVIETSELHDQQTEAQLQLADYLLQTKLPEEALTILENATDATPAISRLRAQTLRAVGRQDEALTLLTALVAAAPDDADSVFALADTAAAAGHYAQARDALKRALPLVPTLQARADIFQRQAELFEKENHWAAAAEAWTTASRLQPASSAFLYRLASCREKEGSTRQALEVLRRARNLDGPEKAAASNEWMARLQKALGQALPEEK